MSTNTEDASERDHLEHLPGRSYLLVVAAVSVAVLIVAASQLMSSTRTTDTVWWGVVLAVATASVIALAVAWEERRAHIHAVLRQAVDAPADRQIRTIATAELLRLGAHREVEYLHTHTTGGEA